MTNSIILYRSSDDFADVDNDPVLAESIHHYVKALYMRILYIDPDKEQLKMYINIKYGDSLKTKMIPDFSPVPGVDYVQSRKR